MSAIAFASPASATTAEKLNVVCNTPSTEISHEVNLALCVGYIHGVIDHESLRSENVAANGIFCIYSEVSSAELRGIVRRYLATRYERGTETANVLVGEALARAFPCRKAG
ncbi:Rap1a/Tai family immunity protein [Porphyrobacter sp. MBR-155]|uniref:Rap1a/Tai family immunity protein n=1 Tax=Porphyrobacter sp. MBR-155 TaxID=3156464 RepID=UPI0033912FAA